MQQMTKRWKVTNTTIKPARYNSAGVDIRPIRDRVGHAVQWVDSKGKLVTLYQTRSTIADDYIPEGLLLFHRKGLVSIEEMKSIADELKNYKFNKIDAKDAAASEEGATTSEGDAATGEDIVASAEWKLTGRARAVPMGTPATEDSLVYTDGKPNHIATKPTEKKVKR